MGLVPRRGNCPSYPSPVPAVSSHLPHDTAMLTFESALSLIYSKIFTATILSEALVHQSSVLKRR